MTILHVQKAEIVCPCTNFFEYKANAMLLALKCLFTSCLEITRVKLLENDQELYVSAFRMFHGYLVYYVCEKRSQSNMSAMKNICAWFSGLDCRYQSTQILATTIPINMLKQPLCKLGFYQFASFFIFNLSEFKK